ncbi:MAG: hypothetical protein KDK36_14085 [Leptospiraceae bacterium]|nr:hypothetical protein [Leptospiraceae bacterium]
MKYEGILVDGWFTYPFIHLWCKSVEGENSFFKTKYTPFLYVRVLSAKGHHLLLGWIHNKIYEFRETIVKKHVWTNKEFSVHELSIINPRESRKIVTEADAHYEDIRFYNSDLSAIYMYFMDNRIYPFSRVGIEHYNGEIGEIHSLSPAVPPIPEPIPGFSKISLRTRYGKYISPGPKNPIILGIFSGDSVSPKETFLDGSPESIMKSLYSVLSNEDPDIIFTVHGDEFLIPWILRWQKETSIILPLDRHPFSYFRKPSVKKSSFFSYGRVIYKPTSFPFYGRLHIDRGISFFYSESQLEGVLEMSMFSRLPVQKLSRSSPGSAMSAMEDEVAISMGYAIPREKGKASHIRPLSDLLLTDQGGMTYRPPVGMFENVHEFDFRSLYPALMVLHNISGETTNCTCCQGKGEDVPRTPYYTCRERRGIVSETLKILLDRRNYLKNLMANSVTPDRLYDVLKQRDTAIKWCLVTAFGYTGYKNAKYGQREAHESITAWGRESLLVAKEISEGLGYEFLHALTDSLWVREISSILEPMDLIEQVKEKTGLTLIHEAFYSWVYFPESKIQKNVAPANRYLARSEEGSLKVRGFLSRRKDTPLLIKNFQKKIFEELSKISKIEEIKKNKRFFNSILMENMNRLISGKFEPEELVFHRVISRPLEEYSDSVYSVSRLVLQMLKEQEQSPIGGEKISYVVSNHSASRPKYRYTSYPFSKKTEFDIPYYCSLLEYSYKEIFEWL